MSNTTDFKFLQEPEFYQMLYHTVAIRVFDILLTIEFWKCIVTVFLCIWYYLFWRPLDIRKDFSEFGFHEAKKQFPYRGKSNDRTRQEIINELRRRRKIGEIPPIYPNGWFEVLESRDLPVGGVREISCLGLNLVVWRGTSGKAYVADAYCPHLGAHLGVYGEVVEDCIKCPFHGWTFEGKTGKCTDIPYSKSVPNTAKLEKVWKTVERNGCIYLWFHAEGEEPTYYPDEFPEIDSGEWKYRGRTEHRVVCHSQDVSENGADMNHLNIVHPSALTEGGKPQDAWLKWNFMKHTFSASWEANDNPKLGQRALMTVHHKIVLFNRFCILDHVVKAHQVGPGTVFLKFVGFGGEGVMLFSFTPLEPMLLRITHRFYSSRTLIHPVGMFILWGEATQVERDLTIWNRKRFLRKPLLTKEDKTIQGFRRWYSQFYSKHSPRLRQVEEVTTGWEEEEKGEATHFEINGSVSLDW